MISIRCKDVETLFLISFLFVASLIILLSLCNNVSADIHVWDGEDTGPLFSADANWMILGGANDVEPETGDDVKFWDVDDACTWDVTTNINSVVIAANYSGVITQGANDINIGAGGFGQATGSTFTGDAGQWVNCAGDFSKGGTITNQVLRLNMSGAGKILDLGGTVLVHSLIVSGSTTIFSGTPYIYPNGGQLIVTGSVSIPSGKELGLYQFDNMAVSGSITGAGMLILDAEIRAQNLPAIAGTISCATMIQTESMARVSKLTGDVVFGGALTVVSYHATNTMTLDLNGHSLSATSVIAGTGGVIMSSVVGAMINSSTLTIQPNGLILGNDITINTTVWDSHLGTFAAGNSDVMTIDVNSASQFYDLYAANLNSDISVTHVFRTASLAQNEYSVTIDSNEPDSFVATGPFDGDVYFNGSASSWIAEIFIFAPYTGHLHFNGTMTIMTGAGNLTIDASIWRSINVGSYDEDDISWHINGTTGDTYFVLTVLTAYCTYAISVDSVIVGYMTSSHAGVGNFWYNGSWSDHEFWIYRMTYPPSITTIPDLTVNIGYSYTYSVLADQSVNWTISTNATWLTISGNTISGITSILDVGSYYVHITGNNPNGSAYQNYTMNVASPVSSLNLDIVWMILLLAFTAIGIIRLRLFGIFTGITWIVAALIFFYPSYGYVLMLFPLGFGMLWMAIALSELMNKEAGT